MLGTWHSIGLWAVDGANYRRLGTWHSKALRAARWANQRMLGTWHSIIFGTAYSTLTSTNSAEAARGFLEIHQRDGDQLFSRIVTGDESWVHHSTPETK
ncbi:hypothetical protein LAZ67_1005211 [Cordylochernes scorpioides]|uniref:DUF1579 domain-containing protein n=1 Tax=Cordylochernes scorpioides TaxID=51811 RepID=A0ABY6JYU7_9ARAC|nr:hypothetical protein LAZ67_1005211 [Cordylochernes scorpioides]